MAIRVEDTSMVSNILTLVDDLNKYEIQIGIFGQDDSFTLMIARVHEYGMTIKPVRKRFLTIPLNKKAKSKSPYDFDDLFTFKANSGELYLVREKGSDQLEFMYWLAKSVKIPERSFLRSGYDENKGKLIKTVEKLFPKLFNLEITVEQFYEQIGQFCVKFIKEYMTDLRRPPNSPITLENKKPKSNPLINTGELREKITYKVVRR